MRIEQVIKRRPIIKWLQIVHRWKMRRRRRRDRRSRFGEKGPQWPLPVAVILWAIVVGLVVTGAYLVIYYWVLMPKVEAVADSTILSMALTIAAGTGGLVLLVVNYRKQHDLEESRFVERFGAATAQLGHEDVAIRLAGVYALVGVAERTRYRGQIQQCIDVLCGYLRLPYEPNTAEPHQTSKVIKRPGKDAANFAREEHYKYRQNDAVVRQTIVTVIAEHLQRKARYKWSSFAFNFTGVYFEDATFDRAVFSGEQVSFERATFGGAKAWFNGATFSGERTSFLGATFSGERTWFDGATFSGERTWFDDVTFGAALTWFKGSTFSGERTSFCGATFESELAWFVEATFNGDKTSFKGVTFVGKEVDFRNPRQWNPAPHFDWDNPDSGVLKPDNVRPEEWPPTEKCDPVSGDS